MRPNLQSKDNLVLLNPRMPDQQASRLRNWLAAANHLSSHLFVLTSGSTAASEADFKWVALSKAAVLAAADGANQHLQATKDDIWLHTLPDFHVGGLGIWARAERSGAEVIRAKPGMKWDPREFTESIHLAKVTLTSLVPAQVHDLVEANLMCPNSMRAIVVGGAALAERLYFRARDLGWPLLCSYGMSEVASQAATASLKTLEAPQTASPAFHVMPHLELATDLEGRIRVRGSSLLTGYIALNEGGEPTFTDPKQDGWLTTADFGRLDSGQLTVLGRESDRIKIGGEIANLALLRSKLDEVATALGLNGKVALLAVPDPRLESVIALAVEPGYETNELETTYNAQVMPYEAIRATKVVSGIPRTELGKVKWQALFSIVQEQ